jgi:hypothetical protein
MKHALHTLIICSLSSALAFGQEETTPAKIPFPDIDQTWHNGGDRRDSAVLHAGPYFTPSVMVDINYTYGFNNPIDNTVVGSTTLARHNEVGLSSLNFGGDFTYQNARARFMTQFGTRSTVIPRNDYSPYRGQYNLADVYRYLSEAYVGYHWDKWHGINLDAGLFTSYIGLNSYYQVENWEYQASYTSDNTPWFFNGVRLQIFPTKNLKIEPWIINGWQSYGKFNSMPSLGGNITWMPNSNIKLLTNDYYGTDAAGIPSRKRFHSDNSLLVRYINKPKSNGISKMAFSLTADLGFESGGGVSGFDSKEGAPLKLLYRFLQHLGVSGFDSKEGAPSQYFLSAMLYNRMWFAQNKFAWTVGGGIMTNPGRYLVLYPTGQASPLPNPQDPTKTEGAYPFSANPGDQFKAFDYSTNIDWIPNQSFLVRLEYVHRAANVPYFAGHGGVTSPSGYTTTALPADWRPDLVKSEDRVILALLFRM